jgi:diguanylate cyclase (GGDEF)-like protein
MHTISRTDIQEMLVHLDRASDNHLRWYENIVKVLVCRLSFDPRYAAEDAHRECEFGLWYYSKASLKLRERPGFIALEAEHERMHKMASRLLRGMADGIPVRIDDYEAFAGSLANLRMQLLTLKRELEGVLGDLDPLTGAYNRISLLTWLREQQALVKRGILPCGVAMLDLDHFKSINDRFGHLVGDQVLKHASTYLLDHLRPYDRIFRYGGEEFLLCTPDTDLYTCHALIDRLREGLANAPFSMGDNVIECAMSCGVTLLEGDLPVEKAIERADRAMYAAKHAGRNRTHVWEASLD